MTRHSTDSGRSMELAWTNQDVPLYSTAPVIGGTASCPGQTSGLRPSAPPGRTEAASGPGLTERRCRTRPEPVRCPTGLGGGLAVASARVAARS